MGKNKWLFPIHSHFRKYSPLHLMKRVGAALVRTITSSIVCQFRFPAFCALNLLLSCFATAIKMYQAINNVLVSETKGQEGTMTVK